MLVQRNLSSSFVSLSTPQKKPALARITACTLVALLIHVGTPSSAFGGSGASCPPSPQASSSSSSSSGSKAKADRRSRQIDRLVNSMRSDLRRSLDVPRRAFKDVVQGLEWQFDAIDCSTVTDTDLSAMAKLAQDDIDDLVESSMMLIDSSRDRFGSLLSRRGASISQIERMNLAADRSKSMISSMADRASDKVDEKLADKLDCNDDDDSGSGGSSGGGGEPPAS